MIFSGLIDGWGTKNKARINTEGALAVQPHPHPPKTEDTHLTSYLQFLSVDGTTSGSHDMLVDGSATEVEFYIEAIATHDIYIRSLQFVIADASAVLNKFGNITALTTGCKLAHVTAEGGEDIINDSLKSNFDFVEMCGFFPNFGDGTAAFRASNVESTSEAYVPRLRFIEENGFPFGLRLRKQSTDRIVFTVRDDINTPTVPDRFDCRAKGFKQE